MLSTLTSEPRLALKSEMFIRNEGKVFILFSHSQNCRTKTNLEAPNNQESSAAFLSLKVQLAQLITAADETDEEVKHFNYTVLMTAQEPLICHVGIICGCIFCMECFVLCKSDRDKLLVPLRALLLLQP